MVFENAGEICIRLNFTCSPAQRVGISGTMFSRFGKFLLVVALVISIGGHWAVLQSVAWMGMAVSYSKSGSVSEALVKTFDGKHPCKLCQMVKKGKQSESKQDAKMDVKKLDALGFREVSFDFPAASRRFCSSSETARVRINSPPTPPPLCA